MSPSIGGRICCLLFLCWHAAACSRAPDPAPPTPVESLAAADALTRKYGVIRDRRVDDYLEYLSSRLGRALTPQYRADFEFVLLNSSEPFAISAASGMIMVSRGLFQTLPVEGELAFVLAHEISHVISGHHAGSPGDPQLTEFSLELELAADRQGQGIMALAGYDPRVAPSSVARLARHPAFRGAVSSEIVAARIAQLERAVVESGWRPPGTIDRRGYQTVRHLLNSISS